MSFATANGIRTFYHITGGGPPLLFVAGNGMEHTAFDEQIPTFSQHFRCITYDMRGIGQTEVPAEGYTTRDMAVDALELLSVLGIETAHVAGYSLGGAIAQEMALASPARVKTLSLYSSFDRPDPYLQLRYEILAKILMETTPEIWAMYTALTAFGEDYINSHVGEVREEIVRRIARWEGPQPPSKQGLAGHYRAILSHDATQRLSAIRCPTWIAVGSVDAVTPVSYAKRLHAQIPGSELDIFPGRPHRLLNFDAADFTERALSFLLRYA